MSRPLIQSVRPPFGREVLFKCDRCRSSLRPLADWPTHPRQGFAYCPFCQDVVSKYVRRVCGVCEGAGNLCRHSLAPDEPCTNCGSGGWCWVEAAYAGGQLGGELPCRTS